MDSSSVLIVEDDTNLLTAIKYNLKKEGYQVITATDGASAIGKAHSEHPDLIILDIMLPKLDGFEVCRILRKDMTMPIIMLTAKTEEIDKVLGLEIGADDYITKPFSMRELISRVKAALRRSKIAEKTDKAKPVEYEGLITAGNIEIEVAQHKVFINSKEVPLSPIEYKLLVFLMKNPGQVFSREYLLEKVWGYDYTGGNQTVDVHIRWLRKKIERNPSKPEHVMTVRGFGYKFEG